MNSVEWTKKEKGTRVRDKREIRKLIISALVKISATRHMMAQGKSENRSQKENSSILVYIHEIAVSMQF